MLDGAVVLFVVTLAGILISCKIFEYEITAWRKVGAASVFVILNVFPIPIPIPFFGAFISLLVAPLGLYITLMDETYQRSQVNKVFGLTFAIAVFAVLILYLRQRM